MAFRAALARDRGMEKKPDKLSPIKELGACLDRLERSIEQARDQYFRQQQQQQKQEEQQQQQQQLSPNATTPTRGLGRLLSRRLSNRKSLTTSTSPSGRTIRAPTTPPPTTSTAPKRRAAVDAVMAQFIDWPDEKADETLCIEALRRMAELVVTGENYATQYQNRQNESYARAKEKWASHRDCLSDIELEPEMGDREHDYEYRQLFDIFFERNVLQLIVDLLTGAAFEKEAVEAKTLETAEKPAESATPVDDQDADSNATTGKDVPDATHTSHLYLLPSIGLATQAIQSLSILIQNVSRATSLYVLLSNNHINQLIDFPLERYVAAEQQRTGEVNRHSNPSPELAELTTHFVTFLKSLALRMNAETLQFFLQYPTESSADGPVSATHFSEPSVTASSAAVPESVRVEFPLYERALEFCAAHQDSFVRITAMNICLNTLRLCTVSASGQEPDPLESPGSASSPDGFLHTACPLPFRERLAMAEYTCCPSNVIRLIAPIFAKLAERWNALEEVMSQMHRVARQYDSSSGMVNDMNVRERLLRTFTDKAADLQDELLLLEDVFKVGLVVLNEQMIEMMLATFVYPFLLQPLLQFYKKFTATVDTSSMSDNPLGGYNGDDNNLARILSPFVGPVQTALFTLASVFQFLSNRPLLRLLYTALFHPLSPNSTSVPMVRSSLKVATIKQHGVGSIRLDVVDPSEACVPDGRDSYAFGTMPGDRRLSEIHPLYTELEATEACVFVLAPALAEVLEFRGADMGVLTGCKKNLYRSSVLQGLNLPHEFVNVQSLTVCMVNAALSAFEGKFTGDLLFGVDLLTVTDSTHGDERNTDMLDVHCGHNGDVGLGDMNKSQQTVMPDAGKITSVASVVEVMMALTRSVVSARRASGGWTIFYDTTAAHALLLAVRRHAKAQVQAYEEIEGVWNRAARYVAEWPERSHSPMGGCTIPGAPSVNGESFDQQMVGARMNQMFYEAVGQSRAPVNECKLLSVGSDESAASPTLDCRDAYVLISHAPTHDDMCGRVRESFRIVPHDMEVELELAQSSVRALLSLDALLSFLSDLAATNGVAMAQGSLDGKVVTRKGRLIDLWTSSVPREMERSNTYASVSLECKSALWETPINDAQSSTTISLSGRLAVPCVVEAPPELAHWFEGASGMQGVEAEGVTWQSLYLVVDHDTLLLAQVSMEKEGRVMGTVPLVGLAIECDHTEPSTPARRLKLSYVSSEPLPLALFIQEPPLLETTGPLVRRQYTSWLDVWLEDQDAREQAYQILLSAIFLAKSRRGHRLRQFLAPAESSMLSETS